jgi:hypothetical protein
VGGCGEALKDGLDRLEGNDPAAVAAGVEEFGELADVGSHVEHQVNVTVVEEVHLIAQVFAVAGIGSKPV